MSSKYRKLIKKIRRKMLYYLYEKDYNMFEIRDLDTDKLLELYEKELYKEKK